MEIPSFLLIVVVLFAGVIWLAVHTQKKAVANLRALGERLGFTLRGADGWLLTARPSLEGEMQGRPVRIWTFTTGSGKHAKRWVAAGLVPRELGSFTFDLRPQGLATKLTELFGAKEAHTGDHAFDERWFLQTNAPEALAAALVPEIRERLNAAYAAGARGHFRTEEGWVCYAELGNFADAGKLARLESLLPLLRDLADVAEVCAGAAPRQS